MVYDCFTFCDEVELCKIRMAILDDVVDRFVVVESTKPRNKEQKDLIFQENMDSFEKYKDKIIHVIVDDIPECKSRYTYGQYMRNCALRGLESCTDEDIIILTDLNEIPSPEAVRKGIKKLSKDGCGVLTFEMYQFFYYVNYFAYTRVYCQSKPKMLKYSEFGKEHRSSFVDTTCESFDVNTTPVELRMLMDYSENLKCGGWRFDGVGSEGAVRRFFEALVENVDDDVIQRYISEGRVPRKEDIRLCSVNDDRWIPAYLLEHRGEYSYLFTDVRSCEEIPAWERCVKKIIRNVQRSSKLRKTKHAVGTLIRRVKVK